MSESTSIKTPVAWIENVLFAAMGYGRESRQTAPLQEAEEARAGMACSRNGMQRVYWM